jgi:tetratricopeptide (TPR) repeat protein
MSKPILTIAILLMLLRGVIFADDNESADVYYQAGLKALKDNDYETAIAKLTKAVSYKPEFPSALFRLGECYEKIKDDRAALKNYRLCRKYLTQQSTLSKEDEQLLSLASRRIDQLDVNGKQLARIKNNHITELLKLANQCVSKKYNLFAGRIIERILEIDPNNKGVQELLAKLGKPVEPQRHPANRDKPDKSKPVAKPDPKASTESVQSGDDHYRRGELDEALADYTEAIRLDPKNAEAYNNRALVYNKKGELDKAITDFNDAIKIRPNTPRLYNNRGLAYAKKGNFDKAISDFTEAIKQDSRHIESYGARAFAYSLKGEYKPAIADAEMFLKIAPPTHEGIERMRQMLAEWKDKAK